MSLKVFLTGATGYIGGSVLKKLLQCSTKYHVTALVRAKEAANKLASLNVTPLVGTLDDLDLLTKAAEEADAVINTADADHLKSVQALITGLSKATKPKVFIHTSGTGVLTDNARGNVTADFIYSDLDMKSINALAITQPHKEVDKYIFDHCKHIDSLIIAPPTIYGTGTGPFNKHSIQIPKLIEVYLQIGQAATVGKGLHIWNAVHIEDLADFYFLVLEKALEGKADVRNEGWYFVESGEYRHSDLTKKIAQVLLKKKLIKTDTVREMTKEELDKYIEGPFMFAVGSNSRCKAERSRKLGWKPVKKDIFSSIEEEVDTLVADKRL